MASGVRRLVTVAAIAAVCAGNAGADDGTGLRTSVLTALAATTSFVLDLANPQGIYGTAVVQTQLGRTKVQGSAGTHSLVLYALDGYEYQQIDGSAWQRRKLPAMNALVIAPLSASATLTPKADERDPSGVVYGAFGAVTSLPVPGIGTIPNVSMDCTYDKSTMLLHVCTSQYATLTFHNYNDPKNVVELPADAKNATELAPLDGTGFSGGK
jgi:hypothetical protein